MEGKLEPVIDAGLTVEDFEGEVKDIMAFIFDYYANPRYSGAIPTKDILQRKFDYKTPRIKPKEKFAWALDQLRERSDYNFMAATMGKLGNLMKKAEIQRAKELFLRSGLDLAARGAATKTASLTRNMEERKTRYQQRKDKVDLYGVPSTFTWINRYTLGYHYGDLVLILAKKEVGKTWLAMLEAHTAQMAGEAVMFVSREMAGRTLQDRYDAIHASLPYALFRKGDLSNAQEKLFHKKLREMKELPPFYIPEFEGVLSPMTIRAKARELGCKVIVVDGVYMLHDDQGVKTGWEKHFNIIHDLKYGLCKADNCMLIVTNQLNRDEEQKYATIENAAFSDAYGQAADICVKLMRGADEKIEKEMKMEFLKLREGEYPDDAIRVAWNFDEMVFRSKEAEQEETDAEPGETMNY